MASVTVSNNPSTTGNTLTVNFTTDVTNITDIQITKDGTNYSSATSFNNNSATFNVSSWGNGTYNNCYLKVIYTQSSGGSSGGTTSDVSGSFGALLKSSSKWYVIGDSISDTGLLPQRKYMTVLGEAFPNVTITNVGKDGSHFTNKTTGYSTFASLLNKLPSTAPNVVTVFGGVNDFIQSCTIGNTDSTDTTTFYGAVKGLVSSLKTIYPSAEIIFILPLNMRAGAFSTNSDGTNSIGNVLQDYRDAIENVCANNSIKVIDLHGDSELQPSLISTDGLHPTQDGHALLASKLRAYMPAVPSGSSSGDTPAIILHTISNMTVNKGEQFNILYSTNVTAVKHEISWDGGNTFWDKTSEIVTSNATNYKYTNQAETGYNSFNMAIRVTDTKGNTSTKTFIITFNTTSSGDTDTYTSAVIGDFTTVGNCSGISIDSSNNLVASSLGQWGMVKLNKTVSKLKFNVRGSQADYGALAWYIYNDNGDGTYNMIALGNIAGGENGKRFKMTIPGTAASQIDKLDISTINPGETLTIEMSGSTQTIKRADGSTLTTLTGNMSGWCGQSTNSSPFGSNIQYIEKGNIIDNFTFTKNKRLNDGIVTDSEDGTYYTTVNKNSVTSGASYTISVNSANYMCICFYDSNDNYLGNDNGGFVEAHTDDWSVKALSTTFTIPSNASYLRVTATGNDTQVTGTLTNNGSSTPSNPGSNLLDASGAYIVDDFSSNSIQSNKWSYELGYVRNNELQNYTNKNAEVNDGILALKGIKDSNGRWTGASIISKGHFAFMYGKIECRAKIDPTLGSFSAFWTLGDSFEFGYHDGASPDTLGEWWAWCGEFDVMEFYSGKLTCGTFFNEKEESGRVWYNNYDFNAWHTFAMEWLEDGTLIFSIDGNELSRTNPTDNRAFHIPHFILINQAIGASGGTPADGTTNITQYVDWVKYYPASTENLVENSSDFTLTAMDFNNSSRNCMVRPTFNDNCINKSLTWSSSNPDIIACHSGLCSSWAGANGDTTITAISKSGTARQIKLRATDGVLSQI